MLPSSYPLPGRIADEDEVTRWLKQDYLYALRARQDRETLWTDLWRAYLVQARKRKQKNRANATSPHGGMTIRDLVPQQKRLILSTTPFIRSVANKPEFKEQESLLDKLMQYWFDLADVDYRVLTWMVKEADIFGTSFGIVDHVEQTRGVLLEDDDREEMIQQGIIKPGDKYAEEVVYSGPAVIPIPIEDAFPDPGASDPYEQRIFFYRSWKLASELQANPKYDQDAVAQVVANGQGAGTGMSIPLDTIFRWRRRRLLGLSQDKLWDMARLQDQKNDPIVEVVQCFTGGNLFTLANQWKIIHQESLDHEFPIFALVPDPIPGEVYGKSKNQDAIGSLEQRDFLINKTYESVKQAVDRVLLAVPTLVTRQQLRDRSNGVIWVQDVMQAVKELDQRNMPPEVLAILNLLDKEIERATGLGQPLQSIGGASAIYNETATTTIRRENMAMAPIQEDVKQLERGLIRMAKIMLDIESKYWSGQKWIRLAGVEGAEWYQIDFDKLESDFDFRCVGSQYALNKQNQLENLGMVFPWMVQTETARPGTVNFRNALRGALEIVGIPGSESWVNGDPTEVDPEAEQLAMMQGLRVKPNPDENFARHLQLHISTLQQLQNTQDPNLQRFAMLLAMHIRDTQNLIADKQADMQNSQNAAMVAGRGGPPPPGLPPGGPPGMAPPPGPMPGPQPPLPLMGGRNVPLH